MVLARAGATRVRPGRFLLVCAWSDLGVAVVYAGVGAWSLSVSSFALAFLAATAFPGLASAVPRRRAGRTRAVRTRAEELKAEGGGL
ncbi:hypothetical protein ACIHIX_43145 [Streptomyces sp. NPDC051913]|uniref:hypothetical protein n=1 Tax=Streptomyces sp. NPDC051913 TaxID=3365676 RepID=UPI0037D57059